MENKYSEDDFNLENEIEFEEKQMNYNHNKARVKKEYWIDRQGKIHLFKGDLTKEYPSFHSEIASLLYPDSNRPTDILMDYGWIMVGSTVYNNPIIHSEPSQAQMNKLHDLDLFQKLLILNKSRYVKYSETQYFNRN